MPGFFVSFICLEDMKSLYEMTVNLLAWARGYNLYPTRAGTEGNTIDLTVENSSDVQASHLIVRAVDVPQWIHYVSKTQSIRTLAPHQEQQVTFSFSLSDDAPVRMEQVLRFAIASPSGETWEKQIKIFILPQDLF